MQGFAKIAAPLHALTRESVPFFWSTACQEAFLQLKDWLVSPPVLTLTRVLSCTLMPALGAWGLFWNKDMCPVAYTSRSFSKAE